MVDMNACKKPDGSTDWAKYNQLQRDEMDERKSKGEVCQRKNCNSFVMWSKGVPQTCDDCKRLDKPEELHHPSDVRCPKCGFHWRIGDGDYYEVYAEGTHDLTCPACGTDFEVTTWVSHTFVSPARGTEKDKS